MLHSVSKTVHTFDVQGTQVTARIRADRYFAAEIEFSFNDEDNWKRELGEVQFKCDWDYTPREDGKRADRTLRVGDSVLVEVDRRQDLSIEQTAWLSYFITEILIATADQLEGIRSRVDEARLGLIHFTEDGILRIPSLKEMGKIRKEAVEIAEKFRNGWQSVYPEGTEITPELEFEHTLWRTGLKVIETTPGLEAPMSDQQIAKIEAEKAEKARQAELAESTAQVGDTVTVGLKSWAGITGKVVDMPRPGTVTIEYEVVEFQFDSSQFWGGPRTIQEFGFQELGFESYAEFKAQMFETIDDYGFEKMIPVYVVVTQRENTKLSNCTVVARPE